MTNNKRNYAEQPITATEMVVMLAKSGCKFQDSALYKQMSDEERVEVHRRLAA